jgi:hypothetical protein
MPKTLTTDLRHVDVRRLARDNLLVPGQSLNWCWWHPTTGKEMASIGLVIGDGEVTFIYRIGTGDQAKDVRQRVRLLTTPCNYGRSRPWFMCPYCHRRAALLYVGQEVACRRCNRMAYKVQNEGKHDREVRRLNAIRARLGWEPGFLNGKGWKPKGMHWRTYHRLEAEHDLLVMETVSTIDARLGVAEDRLQRMMQQRGS